MFNIDEIDTRIKKWGGEINNCKEIVVIVVTVVAVDVVAVAHRSFFIAGRTIGNKLS